MTRRPPPRNSPRPLSAAAWPRPPQEAAVELNVIAPTRDDALRQAVTLGIDALIARVTPPGTAPRVRATIPDALARITRIVREGAQPQGYVLTATVDLPPGTVERAVLAQRPDLALTRLELLVSERLQHRPASEPFAGPELCAALTRAGLSVTGPARGAVQAAGHGRRTDVLITGEAFTGDCRAVAGGTFSCASRLEIRVIDLSSDQALHAEAYASSGSGATDTAAAHTALKNVGRAAGQELPAALYLALQSSEPGSARDYTVRVTPPLSFGVAERLLGVARRVPGVSAASLRHLDDAGAVLDVTCVGVAGWLAHGLEAAGLIVTGLNGQTLTVCFPKPT